MPCTTCTFTSNAENAGTTHPIADTMCAMNGASTMLPKLRRSSLSSPATKNPSVKTTDHSALDENVEKNSAMAVSRAISAKINNTEIRSRESTAGASQDRWTLIGDVQFIHASIR